MNRRFRESEFIDFNTGTVKLAPLQLQFRMALAGPPVFADLVRLFQCRMEVWGMGVAVQLLREIEFSQPPTIWSHAAYGLVALLFSYFETIGKTLNPSAESSEMTDTDFECGFLDVYQAPVTSAGKRFDPKEFHHRARIGLYPLGSARKGLWIHNEQNISTQDFDIIRKNPTDPTSEKHYINPHAMVRTIVDHFPGFIERLNDPNLEYEGIRERFKAFLADFQDS